MNRLDIICIGLLLVIMGSLFSLFGNIGSTISFIIAISVVFYIIKTIKEEEVSLYRSKQRHYTELNDLFK